MMQELKTPKQKTEGKGKLSSPHRSAEPNDIDNEVT
jgi:hypothetical protein